MLNQAINRLKAVAATVATAAFLHASSSAYAQDLTCRVVGISDGDTITCLTHEKERIRVRLARIDAPESKQDFGARAKQRLSDKIYGKTIDLNIETTDRYGRAIGLIKIGDRDINLEMVRDGFAWVYRAFSTEPSYIQAENEARATNRGLWAGHKPIAPWAWRQGERPSPAGAYKSSAMYKSMGR